LSCTLIVLVAENIQGLIQDIFAFLIYAVFNLITSMMPKGQSKSVATGIQILHEYLPIQSQKPIFKGYQKLEKVCETSRKTC
jgi:hypothetical protein